MADLLNLKKLKTLNKEDQARLMRAIHVLLMSTEKPEEHGTNILFTGKLEVTDLRALYKILFQKMTGEPWQYSGSRQ